MQLPPFLRFLYASPFAPFELCLVDGRVFVIQHPEFATVYYGGLGVWISQPGGTFEFVEGDAVVSLRPVELRDVNEFTQE